LRLSSASSNTSLQEVDSDNEALTSDCISVDSKSNKINETTSKSRAKLSSLDIEVSFDYNYFLFTAVHSLCVKLYFLHLEHSTTCWSCHFLYESIRIHRSTKTSKQMEDTNICRRWIILVVVRFQTKCWKSIWYAKVMLIKSPCFSHYQYTTNFNNGTWIHFTIHCYSLGLPNSSRRRCSERTPTRSRLCIVWKSIETFVSLIKHIIAGSRLR